MSCCQQYPGGAGYPQVHTCGCIGNQYQPIGCICPPTSEQTCQSPVCPRKPYKPQEWTTTGGTMGTTGGCHGVGYTQLNETERNDQ